MTASVQRDTVPDNSLAEVLFCSPLQPSDHPTAQQVQAALLASWHAHHEQPLECTAELAADYGNDPELACTRMRWCLQMVAEAA
ncbi:hypothetical protein J5X84_27605 [Streptosporangiaceae bacterium NEAU-GS5]|nr:hypothetical protein [Streptosporangiaceae bacterium NEAU-GS5]